MRDGIAMGTREGLSPKLRLNVTGTHVLNLSTDRFKNMAEDIWNETPFGSPPGPWSSRRVFEAGLGVAVTMLRIAADHERLAERVEQRRWGASNCKESKQQPLMNGGTVMSRN
jgi:hypothetical protein